MVFYSLTAGAPRLFNIPVAARVENHLPKLRGLRNTEVRMEIAGFLGVRSARDVVDGGASGGGGGRGGGRLR